MDSLGREEIDALLDECKENLVDDFAHFVSHCNKREYEDAALCGAGFARSLARVIQAIAYEALSRKIEDGLDKREGL